MKISLFIIAVLVISSGAFAGTPTKEMADLTRILFNNPVVSEKLKPSCADRLIDYSVSQVTSGVQKFELTFVQSGNCFPVKALVTIIEDMKPTYADGSPEYKTTIEMAPRQ